MIIEIKLPSNIVNLRENPADAHNFFSFGVEGHMIHSICPKMYFKASVVENPSQKYGLFFFFEGVDKKWSFILSRQGVNFSCQNLSFLKTIAGMGNHSYTTCEKPKFNDISFTVYIINRYFFFV